MGVPGNGLLSSYSRNSCGLGTGVSPPPFAQSNTLAQHVPYESASGLHLVDNAWPKADSIGGASHSVNVTVASPKKKFIELFGPGLGLSHRAIPSGHGSSANKDDVTTFDFPLGYVSHGPRSENLVLKVPKDLSEKGSADWVTTLVGYFIGKGLPYSLVSSATDRLWTDYGLFDTLATDSGIYFFTFSCEEKRDAVLEGGPWYIAGQPLILQPWRPNLRLDKKNAHTIPIWVNIYGVPLELWNPKGISFITSYIGKPLRVDRVTASRRRITYARVCVEVSGDLDLIDKFTIETEDGQGNTSLLDIDVEYQWKPLRCSSCSTFGHDCQKEAYQRTRHVHNPNPSQSGHRNLAINPSRNNTTKDGVWQVVQRKDKASKMVASFTLDGNPSGNYHRSVVPGRGSSPGKQETRNDNILIPARSAASASEHVLYSIIDPSPSCENRTAPVPIDNSFNGLIPYVYDRETNVPEDDCEGDPPCEGTLEDDEHNANFNGVEVEIVSTSPISARHRKREAKMLFSGSRPKGRHRL